MRCLTVTVLLRVAAGLLWILGAAPAVAGPWAREEGAAFIALRFDGGDLPQAIQQGNLPQRSFLGAYGEYGLGNALTTFAEIGGGAESEFGAAGLRYSLSAPENRIQIALDLGLAARRVGTGNPDPLIRFGAAIGMGIGPWERPLRPDGRARNLAVRHGGGWSVIEAAALVSPRTGAVIWQVESTFGLRLTDSTTAMIALKFEDWTQGDPIASASPSVTYRIGGATTLQAGLRLGITEPEDIGGFLSLWQEF